MDSLKQKIPCRERQITQLNQLLAYPWEPFPPAIFLSGHSATGKTLVVTELLKNFSYKHRLAVVNCSACYTSKLLFEAILNQLTRYEVHAENNYASYDKCDKMIDFMRILKQAAFDTTEPFRKKKIFIVLKSCERLQDLDENLMTSFVRLQELTKLNVTVFLLSTLLLEKQTLRVALPLKITFPQYSQAEVVEILLLYRPPEYPSDFYRNYLNLVVSVFYKDCRSLTELWSQADAHFKTYCEPISSDPEKVSTADANRLWRHLTPHLKNALDRLHLRINIRPKCAASLDPAASKLSTTMETALSYELPYYTKYLLIAAYLASYNSEQSDRTIFYTAPGKRKRPAVHSKAKRAMRNHLLGPKLFTSDRLFAIFYAIIGEKLSLTVNLQSQVATLVRLELLTVAGDDCLECCKWRCAVPYDFVHVIAQNVQFNIQKYLS